jgi:hypothetical protein
MANSVVLKRSAITGRNPTTGDLALGELALNTYDGNLFFKKDNGTASILSVATLTGTQTLTNKTLTSPYLNGTVTINGEYALPSTDGTSGQVLATNGAGQLVFADIGSGGGVTIGGYNNSSLNGFPSGDYGDLSSTGTDVFGVSLSPTFSCMDPIGSLQSTDLGSL